MGRLGMLMARAACASAIVCSTASRGSAGVVTLDDGITGDGHTNVQPDDFGCYGFQIGQAFDDDFYPPGVVNPFSPTYITGAFLSVTTPGNVTTKVALTDYRAWHDLLEKPPPQPDGIVGDHAGLTRTVTTPITAAGLMATSAFEIAHAGSGLDLDFSLVQTLAPETATFSSAFHQVYTIKNNGSVAVDVVFHVAWELDLYYTSNDYRDDVVGVSPDFCTLYVHEPGSSVLGIALGDGGSSVPLSSYYGGKQDHQPDPSGPVMQPLNAQTADQHVWNAGGVPVTWRNYIPGSGYDTAGESGTIVGDATIGRDWRFTIAVGDTEVVHVLRRYGSISVPCPAALESCGNGVVDTGELCDGSDTPTCVGSTCAASTCGDGYVNAMAGEQCESSGIDSETCNGELCTTAACGDGHVNAVANELCDDGEETDACNATCTPTVCGDGYVNAVADEQCDTGDLCDPVTCTFTFTIGGGCAGCGAGGDVGGAALLAIVGILSGRRRRARDFRVYSPR